MFGECDTEVAPPRPWLGGLLTLLALGAIAASALPGGLRQASLGNPSYVQLVDVREYAGSGFGNETAHSVRLDFLVNASDASSSGGTGSSTSVYWEGVANGGSSYGTPTRVFQNACAYETSGLNRGLKTSSAFSLQNVAGNGYDTRTETYGLDPQLDYLTSANYDDGNPNQTPTWSYDAAGNRADAACDNLNRTTSIGGAAVTNDILGNRITRSGVTYGWDCLNRLTSLSGSVTASYKYRADGMRVGKGTGGVTTQYRHDAPMGVEDVEASSFGMTVTRYGLGVRGVDLIERTDPQGNVTTGFPIYDAHGNNVATLTRRGTWYSIGDRRSYDAWRVVRAQQSGGDPKLRYCAGLGHKTDDESGLVYMRARYYEPGSGRFISEDPAMHGANWFAYAKNNPIGFMDASGKSDERDFLQFIGNCTIALGVMLMGGVDFSTWEGRCDYLSDVAIDKMVDALKEKDAEIGEQLEQFLPVLKMLKSTMELAKEGEEASWGSGLIKLMGYNMVLMGQMALTEAEICDPMNGGSWWGYKPWG